jgi:hypothetical protein
MLQQLELPDTTTDQHFPALGVESAYGVGTTFTVHLPLHIEGDDFS